MSDTVVTPVIKKVYLELHSRLLRSNWKFRGSRLRTLFATLPNWGLLLNPDVCGMSWDMVMTAGTSAPSMAGVQHRDHRLSFVFGLVPKLCWRQTCGRAEGGGWHTSLSAIKAWARMQTSGKCIRGAYCNVWQLRWTVAIPVSISLFPLGFVSWAVGFFCVWVWFVTIHRSESRSIRS